MVTAAAHILKTNSASAWMSHIESQDPSVVRQLLQSKLAEVPVEAARPSGPRE